MSTAPLVRYALDPTGTSRDNAVSGEVKTLNVAQIRAVAPAYGPFFTEGLQVFDHGNGSLLVRGIDYQVVDLLQSATLKFGKEIAQVILVINQNVSSQVRLNYQVLGGLYQNNSDGLIQLYETAMIDGRGVDWANVINPPVEYPPTLHRHLLEDIYGFEPVIVALERIRNAIVLSDVPAFEALVQWVKTNGGGSVTTSPVVGTMLRNQTKTFDVTTSNNRNGSKYHWSIQHRGTTSANFVAESGEIDIFQNHGTIQLRTSNVAPALNESFDIIIRKDNAAGFIVTTIEGIVFIGVNAPPPGTVNSTMELLNACCLYEPNIIINAKSMFFVGG